MLPRRYGALLRVSGKRQERDETIEIQEQHIRLWCHQRNIDPDTDLFWFRDSAVSGDVPLRQREGGRTLLEHAEQGYITDGIIVYKINRAVREDMLGYFELEYACAENDLTLYATQDSIDTSTKSGRTMARLRAVLAADEKRELVERLADAKRARARMGRWQTKAPYGWQIGEDKRLQLHPTQSPVILEIIRLLLEEGMSVYRIAETLTVSGIPSPKGKPRWEYSVILTMLRNTALYGEGTYNQTQVIRRNGRKIKQVPRPPEEHITVPVEALIDRRTFERIQDTIGTYARAVAHDGSIVNFFWLGMVKCGECGKSWNPQRHGGKGKNDFYYFRHAHKNQHRAPCPFLNHSIPKGQLENDVWEKLLEIAGDPVGWRTRLEATAPRDNAEQRINHARQGVARAEAALSELEASYFERGTTTVERYDSLAPRLAATLKIAQKQLSEAQNAQKEAVDVAQIGEQVTALLDEYRPVLLNAPLDLKRKIAAAVIRRVVIHEHERVGYGKHHLRFSIEWKG